MTLTSHERLANNVDRVAAGGFSAATLADDADIRALLRQSVMPGAVHVAFTREPDYFAGEQLAGADDATLIHRTVRDGDAHLDGVARISTHTLHDNGSAQRLAYFGELRMATDVSHPARVLRDGYRLMYDRVRSQDIARCFTTIASDNHRARRVLEHGRRLGLPVYTPLAALVTLLLQVPRGRLSAQEPDACRASDDTRDELTDFLDRQAQSAHLTPTWNDQRWAALVRHGVSHRDFFVVRDKGQRGAIVAAAAVWDQRAFRQTVVVRYDGVLRWARPVINRLASIGLAPPLPAPGAVLPQGALLGATSTRPEYWAPLLRAVSADAAQRGLQWLLVLREHRDADLATLRRLARAREYHSQLYDVWWPDLPVRRAPWENRPFRPEVGLL